MFADKLLERVGVMAGIFGNSWLALSSHGLLVTFVLYGISNLCLILHWMRKRSRWQLALNCVYAVSTAIGLVRLLA